MAREGRGTKRRDAVRDPRAPPPAGVVCVAKRENERDEQKKKKRVAGYLSDYPSIYLGRRRKLILLFRLLRLVHVSPRGREKLF